MGAGIFFAKYSINRNIVECKSYKTKNTARRKSVLIETLWNVNKGCSTLYVVLRVSINRNIVECKSERLSNKIIYSLGINRNIVECK